MSLSNRALSSTQANVTWQRLRVQKACRCRRCPAWPLRMSRASTATAARAASARRTGRHSRSPPPCRVCLAHLLRRRRRSPKNCLAHPPATDVWRGRSVKEADHDAHRELALGPAPSVHRRIAQREQVRENIKFCQTKNQPENARGWMCGWARNYVAPY